MRFLYFFTGLFLLQVSPLSAQVGIHTDNPAATLEVNGDVRVRKKLFLENPSSITTLIRGVELLIQKTNRDWVQYNIEESKYGPINYAQFVFRKTHTDGLQNFDTKISAEDYIVIVQGYYFVISQNGSTDVTLRSRTNDRNIEGFQFYSYINPATNTWNIKGFVNNSTFMSGETTQAQIDLFMNVIIFRRGLISKSIDPITVNMNSNQTGTAPKPAGF